MNISIFDKRKLTLGEGINKNPKNNDLAWVDIVNKRLYFYNNSKKITQEFKINNTPSAILSVDSHMLKVLDDEGIGHYYFNDDIYKRKNKFHILSEYDEIRANDGVELLDDIYFGVMGYDPKKLDGAVYEYSNKKIRKLFNCRIPNTFIHNDNIIYISDSYEKKIYTYNKGTEQLTLWKDFSGTICTPDGACHNNVDGFYICMWGAGEIHNYKFSGELNKIYSLPVKNPTNCILVNNQLIITSALEDTDDNDLIKWPLSGMTIKLNITDEL